ncbi:YfhO family protein [Acidaminococcus fermentans]|uniref:YfhO family protein n=1 Tax=Acidaminococcus fermentans TaxID=905 RepID=UPI00242DF32B|nr:YfhO family protein [Acidaminococcus fermentans]
MEATKTSWRNTKLLVIVSFLITAILLLILFGILHMTPFGGNSLAQSDANIQYIDFFTYLRGILLEEKSASYTFTKGLGGNIWGVIAYYLLSPLNLLVVFFQQGELHSFYNLLVLLKLSLCSATMAFYLEKRFNRKIPVVFLVLLAISYGLMQYNLEQTKNIMWLDPLYMLPLLLLGTYRLQSGKGFLLLAVSVGLALLFNWYMGMIVTMFAGMWSVWEYMAFSREKEISLRSAFQYESRVAAAILLGVCLAGIVLVPAFASMASGRGHVDWKELSFKYKGNPLTLLQGLGSGNMSQNRYAVLFPGSFSLAATLLFLSKKNLSVKKKKGVLFLFTFILMAFYWQPAYFLFSLLKSATSYWYRYSFVGIFPFLFLAAQSCCQWKEQENPQLYRTKPLIIIVLFWLVLNFWKIRVEYLFVLISSVTLIVIGVLWTHREQLREKNLGPWTIGAICLLSMFEIGTNAHHLMKANTYSQVGRYQTYVTSAQNQVEEIRKLDDSLYRINQVRPYQTGKSNLTANFNEPLAYGYKGISSYTSGPDNREMRLLDHLGYRQGSDNLNVIVGSVLATDSLLGVKYVCSPVEIPGLERKEKSGEYNQELIYQNPYVFPLAFLVKRQNISHQLKYNGDPFLYANEVYSILSGGERNPYRPIPFKVLTKEDNRIVYQIDKQNGNKYPVYGNIPTPYDLQGNLLLNQKREQGYTCWLSPSVFLLPNSETDKYLVQLDTKKRIPDNLKPQFYELNLAILREASQEAWKKAAVVEIINDKFVRMQVDGSENQLLFTSIPYDKGWDIQVNGQKTKPILVGECLMAIPLEQGENRIELRYHLPGIKLGMGLTLCGVAGCFIYLKRKRNESRVESACECQRKSEPL